MHLNVDGVSVWVGKIHHSTSRHTHYHFVPNYDDRRCHSAAEAMKNLYQDVTQG